MSRNALPQNYKITDDIELERFSTGWYQVSGSGVLADDTTHFWRGTKGLKLTTPSDGSEVRAEKVVNMKLVKNNLISFYVYIHDDISKYNEFKVLLSSVSDWSKYKLTWIGPKSIGWNKFILQWSGLYFSDAGESFDNTMIKMRFCLSAKNGNQASITLGAVDYGSKYLNKTILRFDDAQDTVYTTTYPIMKARGLKGTIYAIGSFVGTAGYCTLAQLKEMYNDGWDVGSHSYTHPDFTTLTLEQTRAEMVNNQNWLVNNGFTRSFKHYALPGGTDNAYIRQVISELAFDTVVTSNDLTSVSDYNNASYNYYLNLVNIPSKIISNTTTLQAVKTMIEQSINYQNVVIMLHSIKDPQTNQYQWSVANFTGLCDYLVQRKIDAVTISAFKNGLTNPRKLVNR
jgi:peptidoglycan/xylan/chitin deacetylase (PgdA/CDA1 family)